MGSQFEVLAGGARPNFYALFGEATTFTQGANVVTMDAIRGNVANRLKRVEDLAVWAEYAEFVCKSADLGALIPARGDVISVAGETWRVLSPEGLPVYEYIDAENKELRIFAKLKGA